jgi:hypothetical protein
MTEKEIKNVTASLLAKLRNNSKSSDTRFQHVYTDDLAERLETVARRALLAGSFS